MVNILFQGSFSTQGITLSLFLTEGGGGYLESIFLSKEKINPASFFDGKDCAGEISML